MKKILSICLAIVMLAGAAVSTTAASISELEARQAELESQQEAYKSQLAEKNSAVTEQQSQVDALVGQVESVTAEIKVCYQKIGIYEEQISEKQTAIDAANADIETNMNTLRQRIKTIYISGGDVSSLEIVLGAKDFGDFLDKVQLVQYVSNHDEELINGIEEQLEAISGEKEELESAKAEQEAEQQTLTEKKGELNTLLEENKETLAGLQSEAADAQMQLSLSEEELSGLSTEIQEYYRKQREAAAQAQTAASSGSGDDEEEEINYSSGNTSSVSYNSDVETHVQTDGTWTWPTPGNYTITSQYGEGRSYETHNALDIGTYIGEPIYAANAGTVVSSNNDCPHTNSGGNWCNCGGGYGNYVWILHDNGYETIYGHMIETRVSTGDRVANGQLIGLAGSSGWSTGCHLHFELRINGVKSNPWNLY